MTQKPLEITIISKIQSPEKALSAGEVIAKVRDLIEYSLERVEGSRWKIILTRGRLEDLQKAIKSTHSIELADDQEGMDVDVSDL
jgi:hypothetical protein